jgi:hypothetical protein
MDEENLEQEKSLAPVYSFQHGQDQCCTEEGGQGQCLDWSNACPSPLTNGCGNDTFEYDSATQECFTCGEVTMAVAKPGTDGAPCKNMEQNKCCGGEQTCVDAGAQCPGAGGDPHVVPFHGDPYDL